MVKSFVVAVVVGVSDICVVDVFIEINTLFGAGVLLGSLIVVTVKNEPTEVPVKPACVENK